MVHYWSRHAKSSTAEVDFLAVQKNNIFPVEVKSGSSGRLKSLHLCLHKYKNCPSGIVFSSRLYAELPEQNIYFIPIYFAFSASESNVRIRVEVRITGKLDIDWNECSKNRLLNYLFQCTLIFHIY